MDQAQKRKPDGALTSANLNELVEVKTWELKFGGAARIISPLTLIELVQEELTLMNENYAA